MMFYPKECSFYLRERFKKFKRNVNIRRNLISFQKRAEKMDLDFKRKGFRPCYNYHLYIIYRNHFI